MKQVHAQMTSVPVPALRHVPRRLHTIWMRSWRDMKRAHVVPTPSMHVKRAFNNVPAHIDAAIVRAQRLSP